jgi:signal transduction histidine kinase
MKPGLLFWKLFLGNAVLMAALLVTLGWITIATVDKFSARDLTEHLHTQAASVVQAIGDRFDVGHATELDRFVKRLRAAQTENIRYTLILADGRVIADSEADPVTMEPHGARKEVQEALIRVWGEDTRFSQTLGRETKYVAVRIGSEEHPVGVMRVAMPLRSIAERTRAEHKPIWMIASAGIVTVVLLALGLARLWSRPIRRITLTAQSISRGDLSARVPVTGHDEIAALAESLNQMRDHLANMVQIKADFAANTSHELRTPLSAIRGAVETLLDMDFTDDPESARKFLGVIDRHSSRMMAMITDLLNLSRLESSQGRFEPTTVRPREFLAELQTHYSDILLSKNLHWQGCSEEPLETIAVNPYLLRLTLDNLVDNAIKFTESGGRISVACRRDAEQSLGPRSVLIEVADTGCGIPEEEQGRVFERFYQVERARSGAARGTGLGLSIVRHAVAAMHGTVALRSKVGEGTTVTITIPQPSPSNPGD